MRTKRGESMEQRRNESAGKTGDPRENPLNSGIVRHDSHVRKFGAVNRTRFCFGGSCATVIDVKIRRSWRGGVMIANPSLKAVHDQVSTFEFNLRKNVLLLPAYILTGALNDMRPEKLVTMEGKPISGSDRNVRNRFRSIVGNVEPSLKPTEFMIRRACGALSKLSSSSKTLEHKPIKFEAFPIAVKSQLAFMRTQHWSQMLHARETDYALAYDSLAKLLTRQSPTVTDLICTVQRHDGNIARLARRSNEALGVRVSVARIAPSFLDLGRGFTSPPPILARRVARPERIRFPTPSSFLFPSPLPPCASLIFNFGGGHLCTGWPPGHSTSTILSGHISEGIRNTPPWNTRPVVCLLAAGPFGWSGLKVFRVAHTECKNNTQTSRPLSANLRVVAQRPFHPRVHEGNFSHYPARTITSPGSARNGPPGTTHPQLPTGVYNIDNSSIDTAATYFYLPVGVAAAGRLACSLPTKANRVQSPAGVTPGFSHVGIVPDDAAGISMPPPPPPTSKPIQEVPPRAFTDTQTVTSGDDYAWYILFRIHISRWESFYPVKTAGFPGRVAQGQSSTPNSIGGGADAESRTCFGKHASLPSAELKTAIVERRRRLSLSPSLTISLALDSHKCTHHKNKPVFIEEELGVSWRARSPADVYAARRVPYARRNQPANLVRGGPAAARCMARSRPAHAAWRRQTCLPPPPPSSPLLQPATSQATLEPQTFPHPICVFSSPVVSEMNPRARYLIQFLLPRQPCLPQLLLLQYPLLSSTFFVKNLLRAPPPCHLLSRASNKLTIPQISFRRHAQLVAMHMLAKIHAAIGRREIGEPLKLRRTRIQGSLCCDGTPTWSDEGIREDQMNDTTLQPLLKWKEAGCRVGRNGKREDYLAWGQQSKYRYWAQWNSLVLKNGALYRNSGMRQPVEFMPDNATGRRYIFLGDLPPLHSGAAPYSPHFTLIGSEDLGVWSRPNLFTTYSPRPRLPNPLATWPMRMRRGEYGAAPRQPENQRHRPARFVHVKIRERPRRESNPFLVNAELQQKLWRPTVSRGSNSKRVVRDCCQSLLPVGECMKIFGRLLTARSWEPMREIPAKTRRTTASSGTIPTCENPVTRPGIEPGSLWWEASVLMAQSPWPLLPVSTETLPLYNCAKPPTSRGCSPPRTRLRTNKKRAPGAVECTLNLNHRGVVGSRPGPSAADSQFACRTGNLSASRSNVSLSTSLHHNYYNNNNNEKIQNNKRCVAQSGTSTRQQEAVGDGIRREATTISDDLDTSVYSPLRLNSNFRTWPFTLQFQNVATSPFFTLRDRYLKRVDDETKKLAATYEWGSYLLRTLRLSAQPESVSNAITYVNSCLAVGIFHAGPHSGRYSGSWVRHSRNLCKSNCGSSGSPGGVLEYGAAVNGLVAGCDAPATGWYSSREVVDDLEAGEEGGYHS
ncbi:hypothetical protein PR048_002928 [Dryococelus australis]|uniref:Uncharacterized protein n=1 Tax=Dryococelus australis TaxID=614101 RepID=A0ABQ9IMZ9_9NEOP|nr:hypothetical protein PR048_002928 [Dryococelus australis]